MINFEMVMDRLAKRRPIFHSEADFQHELAVEVRMMAPELNVRLERPFPGRASGAIDVVIGDGQGLHAIELKYLTRSCDAHHRSEDFRLKQQGAQDIRRYDVCKDVERMEEFASTPHQSSSVIVLTNDPQYWDGSPRRGTIAEAFCVANGRALGGELRWAAHAGSGTTRNREKPIIIDGPHALRWKDYSDLGRNARFRYLHIAMAGKALTSKGDCKMPSKEGFRSELRKRLRDATTSGAQELNVNAGELHGSLGGYPGPTHKMPSCCDAMHEEMRAGDEIVTSPPKGRGASLTIRYALPRW